MSRKRKLLVPEAREALNRLMQDVLLQKKPTTGSVSNEEYPTGGKVQREETRIHTSTQVPSSVSNGSMVEKMILLAKEQIKNDPSKRRK